MTRRPAQVSAMAQAAAAIGHRPPTSSHNLTYPPTNPHTHSPPVSPSDHHHHHPLSSSLPFSTSSTSTAALQPLSPSSTSSGKRSRKSVMKDKKLVRTSPRFNPNFYAMFERDRHYHSNRQARHPRYLDDYVENTDEETDFDDGIVEEIDRRIEQTDDRPDANGDADKEQTGNGPENGDISTESDVQQPELTGTSVYDELTDLSATEEDDNDIEDEGHVTTTTTTDKSPSPQSSSQSQTQSSTVSSSTSSPLKKQRQSPKKAFKAVIFEPGSRRNIVRKDYSEDGYEDFDDDLFDDDNDQDQRKRPRNGRGMKEVIKRRNPERKRLEPAVQTAATQPKTTKKLISRNSTNYSTKTTLHNKSTIIKTPTTTKTTKATKRKRDHSDNILDDDDDDDDGDEVQRKRKSGRVVRPVLKKPTVQSSLTRRQMILKDAKDSRNLTPTVSEQPAKRRKLTTPSSADSSPSSSTSSSTTTTTTPPRRNGSETAVKSSPSSALDNSAKSTDKSNIDLTEGDDLCQFCRQPTEADYQLGELRRLEDIITHTYCLLFASGLVMAGEPHEGIEGFLPKDIRKELKRGRQLKCSYCPKKGAVVGCEVKQCKANYHLPCGILNGAYNEFHNQDGSYPSSCINHRQPPPRIHFEGSQLCTICQEDMECPPETITKKGKTGNSVSEFVHYNCCGAYFHRDCICQWAYHEGDLKLRCPNCKNDQDFREATKKYGIPIPRYKEQAPLTAPGNATNEPVSRQASEAPTQEASPPTGSQGSRRRRGARDAAGSGQQPVILPGSDIVVFTCGATRCKCQEGRGFNGLVGSIWELYACDRCGANSIHVACRPVVDDDREWFCETCGSVG